MKMSMLLKLVVLFSFLITCKKNYLSQNAQKETAPIHSVVNDTLLWKINLQQNVNELVSKNDYTYIQDSIFGDCIENYIQSENEAKKIVKKDIVENFDMIFDQGFITKFPEVFLSENESSITWYRRYKNEPISIKNTIGDLYCAVSIAVKNSETESSKIYWFHQIKDKWYFCGLTCSG